MNIKAIVAFVSEVVSLSVSPQNDIDVLCNTITRL